MPGLPSSPRSQPFTCLPTLINHLTRLLDLSASLPNLCQTLRQWYDPRSDDSREGFSNSHAVRQKPGNDVPEYLELLCFLPSWIAILEPPRCAPSGSPAIRI